MNLVRGLAGKPSHPPLTDASIGAYTIGVAMLVAGSLGLEQDAMAKGGLIAISGGLLLALPTALTGIIDWLVLPTGTPARRIATLHMLTMLTATALFAGAWLAQRSGYDDGIVTTAGLALAAAAELLLVAGGMLGGALVFVYGVRVVRQQDVSLADALLPGRLTEGDAHRTDWSAYR